MRVQKGSKHLGGKLRTGREVIQAAGSGSITSWGVDAAEQALGEKDTSAVGAAESQDVYVHLG